MLRSKALELEQLTAEYEEIRKQVKSAKSPSQSSKKAPSAKGTKDKKKKRQQDVAATADVDDMDDEDAGKSLVHTVSEHIFRLGALGAQHSAYWLFGVAATGIYLFGDAASV
jgi:hypothetical protein